MIKRYTTQISFTLNIPKGNRIYPSELAFLNASIKEHLKEYGHVWLEGSENAKISNIKVGSYGIEILEKLTPIDKKQKWNLTGY